jgi:hypothetical protein
VTSSKSADARAVERARQRHRHNSHLPVHIRGQPRERACTMLVRTAIMFEIVVDRPGWPSID